MDASFVTLAAAMPPTLRHVLVDGAGPSAVSLPALLAELDIPAEAVASNTPVTHHRAALDGDACAALRRVIEAGFSNGVDTVDGAANSQLRISFGRLEDLIGATAARRLAVELPIEFCRGHAQHSALLEKLLRWSAKPDHAEVDAEVRILGRRYALDSRPWIVRARVAQNVRVHARVCACAHADARSLLHVQPFHADASAITVNVALSAADASDGGQLLAAVEGRVAALSRAEGDAHVHDASLLHSVSAVSRGVRHSLILFIGYDESRTGSTT
jgi:hypothetical protein